MALFEVSVRTDSVRKELTAAAIVSGFVEGIRGDGDVAATGSEAIPVADGGTGATRRVAAGPAAGRAARVLPDTDDKAPDAGGDSEAVAGLEGL